MALILNDQTANAHTLTNVNAATEWTTNFPFSASTEAARFIAASQQQFSTPNISDLNITTTITLECQFRRDTTGDFQEFIAKNDGSNNQANYRMGFMGSDDKISFQYTSGGGTNQIWKTTSTFTDTGWHHFAFTFTYATGSSIICYYDTVSQGGSWTSGDGNSATDTNTKLLLLGGNSERSIWGNGKGTEFRVWNVIRTAGQIAANYNIQLNGTETGLVGYWPFQVINSKFGMLPSDI